MGYSVTTHHSDLTGSGTAQGYVTIADPINYPIGAIVTISNRGTSAKTCTVTEVNTTAGTLRLRANQVLLPNPTSPATNYHTLPVIKYGGGTDLSAYTTGANACVDMDVQVVPGRTSP